MLKVLYISDLPGVHDYKNLDELIIKGNRVLYLCNSEILDHPAFKRIGFHVPDIQGLEISNNPRSGSKKGFGILSKSKEVKKIFKKFKPDVIYTGWIQTSGWLAAFSGIKPYIIQSYGSDVFMLPESGIINRYKTIRAVKGAAKVICNSTAERDILRKLVPKKSQDIIFIPRGVDLQVFTGKASHSQKQEKRRKLGLSKEKIIVSTKNFRSVYGLNYLLEGFSSVLLKFPNTQLVMIGGGPEEKNLKMLASQLKLKDENLIWAGFKTPKEIFKYFQAADLFVSPSLSDGSSVSMLEGMAAGLPVVVSNIPGHREWIVDGQNGLFFDKKDAESLAASVIMLLDFKPDKLGAIGDNNLNLVRDKGDFHKNFEKILKILEEI